MTIDHRARSQRVNEFLRDAWGGVASVLQGAGFACRVAVALYVGLHAGAARAEPSAEARSEDAEGGAEPSETSPTQGRATDANDDGWPDASEFLEKKYGFLPIVMPITEPAVGYGAAGGLAFLSKPLGDAQAGLGRPNITFVGGMGTENGTWGAFGGDLRFWLDDRLQTLVAGIYASVNLDFHGVGDDSVLNDNPLHYNLEPKGGTAQAKYRFGETRMWGGLGYAYVQTGVEFDAPDGAPNLPDFQRDSNVGVLTPSFTWDTRDNMFTTTSGTYLEASVGVFSPWLGADDAFQRPRLIVMQFVPLPADVYFGARGDAAAVLGDAPFYLMPFIALRGVPAMRYQGEEIAQLELELRWQFYKRLSLVGFGGFGAAWNDFEKVENTQSVVSGGGGFRYELARKFGIHMGIDVAFSPDDAAFYVQVGSAWMRP